MNNNLLIGASNNNRGELITDIREIFDLAKKGTCVVYRGGRTPAAFIQCFQAYFLQLEIERKVIYHYKKKQKCQTNNK